MRSALFLPVLASTGCVIGAGSSNVGQWRAQRAIDSTVCVQASDGSCARTVAVGRDLPARSFGGGLVALASPGYAQRRSGSDVTHGAVFDSYYEYFRGRGGYALGGRLGADFAFGFRNRLFFTTPLSAVAHAGGGWGSLYGGGGYSLVASERGTKHDAPPAIFHHDAVHAFLGSRIVLRETLEMRLSVNPELRYQYLGGASFLSVSANLGAHL